MTCFMKVLVLLMIEILHDFLYQKPRNYGSIVYTRSQVMQDFTISSMLLVQGTLLEGVAWESWPPGKALDL